MPKTLPPFVSNFAKKINPHFFSSEIEHTGKVTKMRAFYMGVFHTCLSFNGQLGFRPKCFLSWYKSKFWNRITEPVYLREIFKKQVGLNKTRESLSLCQRGGGTIKEVIKCHFQSGYYSCIYAQNTPD